MAKGIRLSPQGVKHPVHVCLALTGMERRHLEWTDSAIEKFYAFRDIAGIASNIHAEVKMKIRDRV